MSSRSKTQAARPWYVDAATSFAFFFQGFVLARWLRGIPPAAVFIFLTSAGTGWFFARSAWRGLLTARK